MAQEGRPPAQSTNRSNKILVISYDKKVEEKMWKKKYSLKIFMVVTTVLISVGNVYPPSLQSRKYTYTGLLIELYQ